MPDFQTAITRQFDGDNLFFKVLIERATHPAEYDGVLLFNLLIYKPFCP
jgi:hypothetical protein